MSQTQSLGISSTSEVQTETPSNPLRRVLSNGVKIGITFGILYYLNRQGLLDFSRVKGVLSNPSIVIGALLIYLSTTFAGVIRWRLLLKGQNLPVSMWEAIRLTMIGVFFNTAIPGAVSGDLIKGYYIVRSQPDRRGRIRAFTTLFLDRLLGMSALVCVSFFAMLLNLGEMLHSPQLKSLSGFISLVFLGVLAFYVFVLARFEWASKIQKLLSRLPLGHLMARFFEAVKSYENCRHLVVRGFFISVAIHCSVVAIFMLLSNALGGFDVIPAGKFFFLVPLGLLVTAIPIAPAGLGTGHAAFFWLFQLVGSKAGADLFTAFVSFQLFLSLVGGIFYLKYRSNLPKTSA